MTSVTAPTQDELVEALGVAGVDLDAAGRRIALATYPLLARGRPVTVLDIAAAAGVSVGDTEARLEEWAGVFRDRRGAVIGFWGLSLRPLDPEYRLRAINGTELGYAWCAWDTLFLPALLNQPVRVEAFDGHSGAPIHLTVSPNSVAEVTPPDAVVSFLAPTHAWDAALITTFCHKVVFFSDRNSADRWVAAQTDDLFTLDVADAFEIGRRWRAARFADTSS